jgi:signal transduction histidine kinase
MTNSPVRRPERPRFFLGPSQRLVGVFVLFILLPGAFLGIFALRVLRQEGQLARQRTRERLERTAVEVGRDLNSEFRQWTDAARAAAAVKTFNAGSFPDIVRQALLEPGGGVYLTASERGLEAFPAGALLYASPAMVPSRTSPSRFPAGLTEAESLEMVREDYPNAIRAYRNLLDSAGAGLRPLVLQRLARTLRKAGKTEEAAEAYQELQRLNTAWIGGLPSDLIAQSELCSLAAERGDSAGLSQTAMAFFRDLTAGKWVLDKPRYLFYSDRCRTWCRESQAAPNEFERVRATEERKLALSRAAEDLLDQPRGMHISEVNAYLAFRNEDPFAMVVVSAAFLESRWWPQVLSTRGEELEGTLSTPDGQTVFGSSPSETPPLAVTHDFRINDTPWLLQVWPSRPEAITADIRQRQALSVAMLAFVVVLLAFGSYITVRIVRRELEIARLRADFVSTVSHEFRSPLTGIRQLGGMLLDGRVTDPVKQQGYFRMIVQESDRLARLVENILDFSRMEEGRREYRIEPLDPTPWLRKLAADFEAEVAVSGAAVEADIPDGLPAMSADREALGSAVRNLLDNAVKYSPGAKTVWLDAAAEGGEIRIAVRDRGVGISEQDRKHIFDRFYRADGEISKQVKGAGLGLSLVRYIVTAHGGTVECQSRVGEGSTFTIRLPIATATGGG